MARLFGYHGDFGQSGRRDWKYDAILVREQRLIVSMSNISHLQDSIEAVL
jgi:hypothetical protein